MGNCKSIKCKAPKKKCKLILKDIFYPVITNATKPLDESNSNLESISPKLKSHVLAKIKGLIDHLEDNHDKLIYCGHYLNNIIRIHDTFQVYIVCLFTLNELLVESKKFIHDSDLVNKMRTNRKSPMNISDNPGEGIIMLSIHIKNNHEEHVHVYDNIIQFEELLLDILIFIFTKERSSKSPFLFQNLILTLQIYGNNKITEYYSDKLEIMYNVLFEYLLQIKNQNDHDYLNEQIEVLKAVIIFAKLPNFKFFDKFKQKYLEISLKWLIFVYKNQTRDDIQDLNKRDNIDLIQVEARVENDIQYEYKRDKEQHLETMKKFGFELMELLVLYASDLNEFDAILVPFLSYFDFTYWNNELFQTEFISKLLNPLLQNDTTQQRIEFYLIEKIVEYSNHHKFKRNKRQDELYKNSQLLEIKIKVFNILSYILENLSNSNAFNLSMEHIIECLVNNIDFDGYTNADNDTRFKEIIYKCHDLILSRMINNSDNLMQILVKISMIAWNKISSNAKEIEYNIHGHLEILQHSLKFIGIFPNKIHVPEEALFYLIKIRNMIFEDDDLSYTILEILLNFQCRDNENNDGEHKDNNNNIVDIDINKRSEYLLLTGNIANIIINHGLKILNIYCLGNNQELSQFKCWNFFKFLRHNIRLVMSMLMRRDVKIISPFLFYLTKLIDIINTQQISTLYRFILLNHLIEILENLNKIWKILEVDGYITKITEVFPDKKLLMILNEMNDDDLDHFENFNRVIEWIQALKIDKKLMQNIGFSSLKEVLITFFKTLCDNAKITLNLIMDLDQEESKNSEIKDNKPAYDLQSNRQRISDYSIELTQSNMLQSQVSDNNEGKSSISNDNSMIRQKSLPSRENNYPGNLDYSMDKRAYKIELTEADKQYLDKMRKNKIKKKKLANLIES